MTPKVTGVNVSAKDTVQVYYKMFGNTGHVVLRRSPDGGLGLYNPPPRGFFDYTEEVSGEEWKKQAHTRALPEQEEAALLQALSRFFQNHDLLKFSNVTLKVPDGMDKV